MGIVRRLFAAESGSILVMAAFALTTVMGMTGLAVEVGTGYTAKIRNQRVADMAALGAAKAYQTNSSTAQATQTAKDIVSASGLAASSATVSFPASGVQVQVTTAVPVRLASMVTHAASYNVTSSGTASLGAGVSPACVLALSASASQGIAVTGNSDITATGCAVVSNSPIEVQGSSDITAETITGPSISTTGSSTVHGTQTTGSNATDPLASSAPLAAAFAQLGITPTLTMPTAPTFTSTTTNWSFPSSSGGYSGLAAADPVKVNCTLSGSTYTCNQGTYNINNMTVPSGITVTFSGTSTVYVYGTLSANGATLNGSQATYNLRNAFSTNWSSSPTFGNISSLYVGGAVSYTGSGNSIGTGNVTFAGGLSIGGSGVLTIGAGNHAFGGGISVGGSGTLTMAAGNLIVNGSISVAGSASATFGNGTYIIGNDGSGNAISVNGSLSFGNGDFSADGSISSQGGTNIVFGAGTHRIDGDLSIGSGGTLGAGLYLIDGNFDKNAHNTVTGTDVTIVTTGTFTTGGSSGLVLTAPAADTPSNGALGGILFASKTTTASSVGGSASNTFGGVIYLPNSNLSVSGAGTVASSTCFALIVKTLAVTGSGGVQDTGCTPASVGGNTPVVLIQ